MTSRWGWEPFLQCSSRTLAYCFQVLRAFGIPQKEHLYFISVSGAFLKTSLPLPPIGVGSIYL